jgi:hypothetical protein
MRTLKEITDEIQKLEAIKPKISVGSDLDDYHHSVIDAQIRVLREDMDEEEIADVFDDEFIKANARQAFFWCHDEKDMEDLDAPSEGWKRLVKVKKPRLSMCRGSR